MHWINWPSSDGHTSRNCFNIFFYEKSHCWAASPWVKSSFNSYGGPNLKNIAWQQWQETSHPTFLNSCISFRISIISSINIITCEWWADLNVTVAGASSVMIVKGNWCDWLMLMAVDVALIPSGLSSSGGRVNSGTVGLSISPVSKISLTDKWQSFSQLSWQFVRS